MQLYNNQHSKRKLNEQGVVIGHLVIILVIILVNEHYFLSLGNMHRDKVINTHSNS